MFNTLHPPLLMRFRASQGAPGLIKGALIDLNGTLHVADADIPGSVAALQRLRAAGVQCRFVTNTTKDTRWVGSPCIHPKQF